ncbi:MAG: helix-turn-helix domain-containing protein, partial [Caulobacteraceae bacterium]
MPLDAGVFADGSGEGGRPAPAPRQRLALEAGMEVGAAMKRAREGLGLSLAQIAETTRVRERHLAAIEGARIDQLPSRPFIIGYVRAYAKALGLDADATAARYRTEHPSPDDDVLRSPVGVRHNRVARGSGWLGVLAGAMVLAIVGWNIARHAMAVTPPKPPAFATPHAVAVARANSVASGPFAVDTPLPAPPEAAAPAPYI